ncbi:hypothetical protein DPQ22_08360 [Candidatus Tokpelaia sp.]|nr:hypothetical protein DPQ22_08360 [Candidatus Tokpelaia sp.]
MPAESSLRFHLDSAAGMPAAGCRLPGQQARQGLRLIKAMPDNVKMKQSAIKNKYCRCDRLSHAAIVKNSSLHRAAIKGDAASPGKQAAYAQNQPPPGSPKASSGAPSI